MWTIDFLCVLKTIKPEIEQIQRKTCMDEICVHWTCVDWTCVEGKLFSSRVISRKSWKREVNEHRSAPRWSSSCSGLTFLDQFLQLQFWQKSIIYIKCSFLEKKKNSAHFIIVLNDVICFLMKVLRLCV